MEKINIQLPKNLPDVILRWFRDNKRDLPWRQSRKPYRVWVSEIMLQQTRAETVRERYPDFIRLFPSVEALADAPDDLLGKAFEGLGYYSRAKNMKRAAQMIRDAFGGRFPESYAELLRLPGVGAYTAGAICSICFGLPTPAVDGNVVRVVARIAGVYAPVSPAVRRDIAGALADVYPRESTGDFTEGLMELGATVCLPNRPPDCARCPASSLCYAKINRRTGDIPQPGVKPKRKKSLRTVFILEYGGRIALKKRPRQGLLASLWELPNTEGYLSDAEVSDTVKSWGLVPLEIRQPVRKKHVFTHLEWDMLCYRVLLQSDGGGFVWADKPALLDIYAIPSAFRIFLPE